MDSFLYCTRKSALVMCIFLDMSIMEWKDMQRMNGKLSPREACYLLFFC